MINWLGPASCLWCLLGLIFSSAEGGGCRRVVFWCDLILHWREAKRKNLVICQSKILFLSPRLGRNTRIDIDSHKRTHTYSVRCVRCVWCALGSAARKESACKSPWIVLWLTTNQESCHVSQQSQKSVVMPAASPLQRGRKGGSDRGLGFL